MSQKNGCGSAIGRAVFWAVFCTLYNAVMNPIACILDDLEIGDGSDLLPESPTCPSPSRASFYSSRPRPWPPSLPPTSISAASATPDIERTNTTLHISAGSRPGRSGFFRSSRWRGHRSSRCTRMNRSGYPKAGGTGSSPIPRPSPSVIGAQKHQGSPFHSRFRLMDPRS